jgi:hypothetical protein
MRIQVTRTGGFAGIVRRAELDTSSRPDAPRVHALAREAIVSGLRTPPLGVPDGFHYELTVDGRTIHCADPELTEAQRELVSLVLKAGA